MSLKRYIQDKPLGSGAGVHCKGPDDRGAGRTVSLRTFSQARRPKDRIFGSLAERRLNVVEKK